MADIRASQERMSVAWKALANKWNSTKATWNDPVSQNFENQYWTVLEQRSMTTLAEMEKLAQVVKQAHQRVRPVRSSH